MMSRSEWPALFSPSYASPQRQRAVAEDRDDLEVLLAVDVARRGHAERGGDRRRGVAGAEGVVLALGALEEAGDAALLAQRLHPRVAAGEQLVRIALMTDVPHELVARRLEHGCSAIVSSTTPRPAPMWPPVREQTSTRRARISSASVRSSSRVRARRSAGESMRSRRDMAVGNLRGALDGEVRDPVERRREQPDLVQGGTPFSDQRRGARLSLRRCRAAPDRCSFCSARSRPAVFPSWSVVAVTSSTSSAIWNARPIAAP